MRIWTLSLAGNFATKTQTTALAEALRQQMPAADQVEITSLIPLPPSGTLIADNKTITWSDILSENQLAEIECENGLSLSSPWPDVVISCRPEVAALALSIKKASGGHCKLIHIQNPNGAKNDYNFNLNDFDLIIRQPHEKIDGGNIISSRLAIHGFNPSVLENFRKAQKQVCNNLQRPLLGVLIGGSDENITFSPEMYKLMGQDLQTLAETFNGTIAIMTSRRTDVIGTEILRSYLGDNPKILFNDARFSEQNLISTADMFIITSDSLSMVAETTSTDKPRIFYSFNGALDSHPLNRVFQELAARGQVTYFPEGLKNLSRQEPINELPELSQKVYMRVVEATKFIK